MVLLGRMSLALTKLLDQTWLLLMGSLRHTSLTTCWLEGLPSQTLTAQISLLAWRILPKIGLIELAATVLLGWIFLLLMGLLVQTNLALIVLLGGTLLSQMGLPGLRELVIIHLIMDLLKEIELQAGTIWDNWGKSFQFKLKSVQQTAFF